MKRIAAFAFAALAVCARAERIELDLTPGKPASLRFDVPLDDSSLRDPRGYADHGAQHHRVVRRIELENTGRTPLTGPLLVVNSRRFDSAEAIRATLALTGDEREWLPRFFHQWTTLRTHASSGLERGEDPVALLSFWGYSLCGDDTRALARLLSAWGIRARHVTLNAHIAAEYFHDGAWRFFDGDQGVWCPRLDGRGLASASELRADPLLLLRVKAGSRHFAHSLSMSAFNTSLLEHLAPEEHDVLYKLEPPAALAPETLPPGGRMIVHFDRAPERAIGSTDIAQWKTARENSLAVVEFALTASRRGTDGTLRVKTAAPILEVVNHTTGEKAQPPPGEPVFELAVKTRAPTDAVSVFCQRARVSLPALRAGENRIELLAKEAAGKARLTVEYDTPQLTAPPPPRIEAPADFTGLPVFQIDSDGKAGRVWWQITRRADFTPDAPNFDQIAPLAKTVALDALACTFLLPGVEYRFRARVFAGGVWSAWCEPVNFRVTKPAGPKIAEIDQAGEGRIALRWPACDGAEEYLIFASNRRDFLPEPYADKEIVRLRRMNIEESRPNKNLIATVREPRLELPAEHHYYRIVARRGAALSVPSPLIELPAKLAKHLPAPRILQARVLNGDVTLSSEVEQPR